MRLMAIFLLLGLLISACSNNIEPHVVNTKLTMSYYETIPHKLIFENLDDDSKQFSVLAPCDNKMIIHVGNCYQLNLEEIYNTSNILNRENLSLACYNGTFKKIEC